MILSLYVLEIERGPYKRLKRNVQYEDEIHYLINDFPLSALYICFCMIVCHQPLGVKLCISNKYLIFS